MPALLLVLLLALPVTQLASWRVRLPPQLTCLYLLAHLPVQVLLEGRAKLEGIVRSRGRAASSAGDHADVLRFTRLHKPLRLQQEGMELLTAFLRRMVAERARADYDALVDSFASGGGGSSGGAGAADYLGTLTNLFKDVAAAIDEHLDLIQDALGPGGWVGGWVGVPGGCARRVCQEGA
jgi:hypothetical protein